MSALYSKFTIHDPRGKYLNEVNWMSMRSSMLNEDGEGFVFAPRGDSKATLELINPGNKVFIESDAEHWGGVIDDERPILPYADHWEVPIVSAERILKWRVGSRYNPPPMTAGGLFRLMLDDANQQADTGITAGDIEEIGHIYNNYSAADQLLLPYIQHFLLPAGQDFAILPIHPDLNNGELKFTGNWWARRGTFVDEALQEGSNIEREDGIPLVSTQGPIQNGAVVVGRQATTAASPRAYAENAESVLKHGLRQFVGMQTYQVESTLQGIAEQWANNPATAFPRRQFNVSAINVGNTFKACQLGNILPFHCSLGNEPSSEVVDTYVRIIGKSYDDRVSGKMPLVLQEVTLV